MPTVEFSPKAVALLYDGNNRAEITDFVETKLEGSVNSNFAAQDGSLLVFLPGGATHVLLPNNWIVDFLGEVRIVPFRKLKLV